MNVTILGSGKMARAIALRLVAGGNAVTLMGRAPDKTAELVKELGSAAKNGASVRAGTLGGPITDGLVVLALPYAAARELVASNGKQLGGKILIDITNPLNQTYDDLSTPPGSSAAEELAKAAPRDTKVVKAFNTVFAALLAQGSVAGQPLDVLIAGDDAQAKDTVAKLISAGGQHPIDAGPLKRARQLENLALLSITLQSKVEKPWMNTFKIVA